MTFTPLKTLIAAGAIAAVAIPAQAAMPFGKVNAPAADTLVVEANARGKRQLKRLMRPHVGIIPVTRAARAATGDPNIQVIDRRYSWDDVYTCSYMYRGNRRLLVCD